MNMRNRRTIEYAQRGGASSARNRIDAIYALSGPYELPYNPKNPPVTERDLVRIRLGALMIGLKGVGRHGSV